MVHSKIKTVVQSYSDSVCKHSASLIKAGEVVAFPTETVYGLGANAFDAQAVKKIFIAKNRPPDNPLVVHIANKMDVLNIASTLSIKARQLIDAFWPGPLTLVLPSQVHVPTIVRAGLSTVAVRMPSNEIALSLIRASGVPLAAPSANMFGKPSPTCAEDVLEDMDGRIPLIIDGGRTNVGIESTIISMVTEPPTILRQGGLRVEEIEQVIGKTTIHKSAYVSETDFGVALAPGMKYRHYSPKATVLILPVKMSFSDFYAKNEEVLRDKVIGVMLFKKTLTKTVSSIWQCDSLEKMAHDLFYVFRMFDRAGVDVIIVEGVTQKGLGKGIMERLKKAHSKV